MLDWFTTIPGILIASGVVLLIVAIILFILGNKKDKKNVAEVNKTAEEPIVETPVVETVQPEVTVEPVKAEVTEPVVQEQAAPVTIDEPIVITAPEDAPTAFEVPTVEPVIEPIVEAPVEVKEEPKVTIYGGNDPLEKTQTIEPINETHQPYGEPEIKIVEPVMVQPEITTIEIPEVKQDESNVEEL